MTNRRIAVICSIESVDWKSCATIATNLSAAYRMAFGSHVRFFSCAKWEKPSDIPKTAAQIRRYDPDCLVFLDHTPHPDTILRPLQRLYDRLPPLVFHVYGDFTRKADEWVALEPVLGDTRTLFVCASPRQSRLLEGMLCQRRSLATCPFPVDSRRFRVDEESRARWRRKLGLKDGGLLVTYAGRLSFQKNHMRLAREILSLAGRCRREILFAVAGACDDIGSPFFGIDQDQGECRREWAGFLRGLGAAERGRIRYLGELGTRELAGLYNAADLYCSLSLYHDEDFGMAPAEALSCGTPCLLTDWGGFAAFAAADRSSRLVPLELSNRGIVLRSEDVQARLSELLLRTGPPEDRLLRSRRFRAGFSIEAVSTRLKELHERRPPVFSGFSALMHRQAEALGCSPPFPGGPRKETLYERVYGAYFVEKPGSHR